MHPWLYPFRTLWPACRVAPYAFLQFLLKHTLFTMLTVVSGLQQNDSVINTCDDSVINTRMRAKLLQSCPTLCNPVDCSPPGFSVHGVSQARIPFFPLSLLSSLFFDVCVTKPSSVTLEVTWSSQNPQIPLIFISTVICPAPWFWETCVASSKNRLSLSLPCFLVFINLKKKCGHIARHVGSFFPDQGSNPHTLHWKTGS